MPKQGITAGGSGEFFACRAKANWPKFLMPTVRRVLVSEILSAVSALLLIGTGFAWLVYVVVIAVVGDGTQK